MPLPAAGRSLRPSPRSSGSGCERLLAVWSTWLSTRRSVRNWTRNRTPHFVCPLQGLGGGGGGPPGPITRPLGSVTRTSLPLGSPFFSGLRTTVTLSPCLSMLDSPRCRATRPDIRLPPVQIRFGGESTRDEHREKGPKHEKRGDS